MPTNALLLITACLFLVLLTFAVSVKMFLSRTREMRQKRIHPGAVSTSADMAARLQDTQAADNFRNLFEVPILFYALTAVALATSSIPPWLAYGAWIFVILRFVHSIIHCTYNNVTHRFTVYLLSFVLLVGLWVAFALSAISRSAA